MTIHVIQPISFYLDNFLYTYTCIQVTNCTMASESRHNVFLFNLETTGLFSYSPTKKQDICQIAVLSYASGISFCRYVVPSIDFDARATAVNGFTTGYCPNGKKILLLNQQEVKGTVSEFQAIIDFVAFLKTNSLPGSIIFLIGYNNKVHDVPFLTKAFLDHQISMEGTVIFMDAYPLIRKIAKDANDPLGQKLATCENLKRQTVHQKLFGITPYNDSLTHDATRDVLQLRDIISYSEFPFNRLWEHIVPTEDLVVKLSHQNHGTLNKPDENEQIELACYT